jgi:hypothetical protein
VSEGRSVHLTCELHQVRAEVAAGGVVAPGGVAHDLERVGDLDVVGRVGGSAVVVDVEGEANLAGVVAAPPRSDRPAHPGVPDGRRQAGQPLAGQDLARKCRRRHLGRHACEKAASSMRTYTSAGSQQESRSPARCPGPRSSLLTGLSRTLLIDLSFLDDLAAVRVHGHKSDSAPPERWARRGDYPLLWTTIARAEQSPVSTAHLSRNGE